MNFESKKMYFILSKLFRKLVIIRIFWVGLRAMGYAGLWDYGAGHSGLRRAWQAAAGRDWGLGWMELAKSDIVWYAHSLLWAI